MNKKVFFSNIFICFTLFFLLVFSSTVFSQESDKSLRPTVKNPVVINFEPVDKTVKPGQESAFKIIFKLPKYIWMGPEPKLARSPAGTKIVFEENENFIFGEPKFPKPDVEGVPVRVGVTNVYQGEVTVIVPFKVKESAQENRYEITTYLTYTPSFKAGKLNTHVREAYRVELEVSRNNATNLKIPNPKVEEVPEDFVVAKENWDLPPVLKPFMRQLQEDTPTSKLFHTIFLDSENHGKLLRQVMYPFVESSLQKGNSYGLGVAVLDATPEGVMTGALSGALFHNEHVGLTGSLILLTCPAAYHNLQASIEFSGSDYFSVLADYENFTLGENDKFGIISKVDIFSDSRYLFYGIGADKNEENVSVYDHQNIGGILDFYYLGIEKFRIGGGIKFRDVEVKRGLDDIDGDTFGLNSDIPLLAVTNFDNSNLNTDASILGGRINFIFDQRNQEFNPTKGFYGKITAEYNEIIDTEKPLSKENYGKLHFDLRKYFSGPSQKFVLLLRNEWVFNSERELPFYEYASLGGSNSLRAFDINRFRDQHSFFASMEMRYTIAQITVMGFPMAMVMGAYLDAGQVFNDQDGLDFNNDFNWSPGISMRIVNYPNVGYTINAAHGQDGIYVSGGISLPF